MGDKGGVRSNRKRNEKKGTEERGERRNDQKHRRRGQTVKQKGVRRSQLERGRGGNSKRTKRSVLGGGKKKQEKVEKITGVRYIIILGEAEEEEIACGNVPSPKLENLDHKKTKKKNPIHNNKERTPNGSLTKRHPGTRTHSHRIRTKLEGGGSFKPELIMGKGTSVEVYGGEIKSRERRKGRLWLGSLKIGRRVVVGNQKKSK